MLGDRPVRAYWKPLAEILLVAFLLCAVAYWCYSRGYQEADSSWKLQWAQRDLTDATTTLQREVTERAEEQRRQRAVDEEREKADEELAKHADWVDEFRPKYDAITAENIDGIVEKEIGLVFMQVLEDAGVYKRTEEGQKAFDRFVKSL